MPAQPTPQAAAVAAKLKAGAVPDLVLHGWNSEKPPLPHQLSGTCWLYLTPRAFVLDSTGVGKALVSSTPVLTPEGWVPIGDIEVGQQVVGTDGKSYPVNGVFPQGEKEVWEASFSDGSVVECCDEHLWSLENTSSRYGPRDQSGKREYAGTVRTTKTEPLSYFATRLRGTSGTKSRSGGGDRWSLPLVSPLELTPRGELPLDPYLLGLLLGDGSFRRRSTVRFSSADQELVDAVRSLLPEGVGLRHDKKYDYETRNSSALLDIISGLDLQGRYCHGKHVPEQYLWASVADRLAVLQGLLDTDGSVARSGAEFSTTSPFLAKDVEFLVRSLGGVSSTSTRVTSYTYKGEKRQGRESYRVKIQMDLPLFRLKRKAERVGPYKQRRRTLRDVRNTGRLEEMVCISVGSPDRLFIVEGFVPTHNTGTAIGLLEFLKEKGQLKEFPGPRCVIVTLATSVLGSWLADGFQQFVPHMKVRYTQDMTKKQRLKVYNDPNWEVLIVSYKTVANDIDLLTQLGFKYIIFDEADALKNPSAQQTVACKTLASSCDRAIAMSATPISEVSLMGLHSIMSVLGIGDFGAKTPFERYYHNKTREKIWIKTKNGPTQIWVSKIESVKNGTEFKEKFAPFFIRRTRHDVKTKMPELLSQPKIVALTPKQRVAYDLAKQGFAKLGPNSPVKELKSAFQTMRQICTTTAFLDEGKGEDHSAKMDKLIEELSPGGDFAEEKAVIFSQWLIPLECMERRLKEAGIEYVKITGAESQTKREEYRQRFWNDPKCRVVLGTTAIEKSISLQVARLQINIDMLFNPARHEQLAGRVQRTGSIHDEAWCFFYIAANTVEEKIYEVLKQKQGLADWVFDADSEVFESLTPMELYQIVRS